MAHNSELYVVIEELAVNAAKAAQNADARHAAVVSGGLPVYGDLGGWLVLMPDCDVVCVKSDTNNVEKVSDRRWQKLAMARAARHYPQLAALRPPRPVGAQECRECGGAGSVIGEHVCGACVGLGWVET